MIWTTPADYPGSFVVEGKECKIWLEPRPYYCDRGNWYAKLDARFPLSREIDEADGWPRYYFDVWIAKLELEAWLRKRGQAIDEPVEPPAICASCGVDIIVVAGAAWMVVVRTPEGISHVGGTFCLPCMVGFAKRGLKLHRPREGF